MFYNSCILISCLSDEEGGEEDDAPKSDWKPPPVIPKEENRTGTNKRTFFATTERKCNLFTIYLASNSLVNHNKYYDLQNCCSPKLF